MSNYITKRFNRNTYNRWLFEEPYRIKISMFKALSQLGIMGSKTAEQIGKNFYAYITMLIFRYLLNGELTAQKKKAFREEANSYITSNLGCLEEK